MTETTTPELRLAIGTTVKVNRVIRRRTKIVDITTNDQGTTLYWLADGGCFGASELEPV